MRTYRYDKKRVILIWKHAITNSENFMQLWQISEKNWSMFNKKRSLIQSPDIYEMLFLRKDIATKY